MDTKEKLFITSLSLAVLAIPTVAWALNGPFTADPELPANPGDEAAGETFGWMSGMHDYMWNDTPADGSYGPMFHMHDYMWNNGEHPEDVPADATWMNDMHDYMWNNGELPEGFAGSMHPMGVGMWGGR